MANDSFGEFLRSFGLLFYLKTPATSSFKKVSEIPNYVQEVVPNFFVLIFLEAIVRWLQGKSIPRVNDSISSITAGVFMQVTSALTGAFEIGAYIWVYKNFHIVDLPWDSPVTWWLAFFLEDFFFYWFHRMAHEINVFWMAHQVHHSSEEYNLTTALRQSLLQRFSSWFFYLPYAVAVPPTAYIVHKQLNLLYQFWIHTEVVGTLGPLEWVLNTPSHHRVHHGRNRYCLDRNYGGVLIIWDRMFGTFAQEKDKVVYGLVCPSNSWNPLWIQFHYLVMIVQHLCRVPGIKNKIFYLIYGPGWAPGTPRIRDITELPEKVFKIDRKLYDKKTLWWLNVYCVLHFLITTAFTHEILKIKDSLPFFSLVAAVLYILYSLTTFGFMFEHRFFSVPMEIVRLAILIAADISMGFKLGLSMSSLSLKVLMLFSSVLWSVIAVKNFTKQKIP